MLDELFDDENLEIKEQNINLGVFDDFKNWIDELIDLLKPDLMVGIARGAIRLLQMSNIDSNTWSIPILSNTALPYLSDSTLESKRVLIYDDSLIFGSTMDSVRKYLISRKAIPLCASYVIDRRNFKGERRYPSDIPNPSKYSDIPINYRHKFWPSEIRVHHDILVRWLLNTPYHYNLDFPTILIKTPKIQREKISELITFLSKCLNLEQVYDVSSADSAANNIYRFSALVKGPNINYLNTEFFNFRSHNKIRFTIAGDHGQIRITPIVQLIMSDIITENSRVFNSDLFQDNWNLLVKPSKEDKYFKRSIFRLLTSLITTYFAKEIFINLKDKLHPILDNSSYTFLDNDTEMVLGQENSLMLRRIFKNDIPTWGFISDNFSYNPFNPIVDDPIQKELINELVKSWEKYPFLKPDKGDLIYEILGKIFFLLRWLTDNNEIRQNNPDEERLNKGFSFGSLWFLLNNICKIEIPMDLISIGIDICIDNGQAVPKILMVDSKWCRLFYSGERTESIDPLQFKNYFYKAYSDFRKIKKSSDLTPFDLHKITVTLKFVYNWIPVTTRYSIYGKIALASQTEEDLIPWLTSGPNSPLTLFRLDNTKNLIRVNKDFRSVPHTAWEKERARNFFDAFQYIALSFGKFSKEQKLLISTCQTHRHTYNSVAYEAYCWAIKLKYNFSTLLSVATMKEDGILSSRGYLVTNIFWCSSYINEALLKFNIFHNKFNYLFKDIAKIFRKQGNPAFRFWELIISTKLDPSREQEIDEKFRKLKPLLIVMRILTSYITKLLLIYKFIDLDELNNKFKSQGVSLFSHEFDWLVKGDIADDIQEYNIRIQNKDNPGFSIFKTNLLDFTYSEKLVNNIEFYRKSFNSLVKCYKEICKALFLFCPEYDVVEGEFPFAPEGNKRRLSDGKEEILFQNMYILTMDIIKSTNNIQTNEMKELILNILENFSNIFYEYTGNDAFIICSTDPDSLFDIAEAIRLEGDRLMMQGGSFGGTRKALAFGSIKIIKDTFGKYAIIDAKFPNIIPVAFSILDSIDSVNDLKTSKNSLIAVHGNSLEKYLHLLKKIKKSETTINLSSKHYHGKCFIYDLTFPGNA